LKSEVEASLRIAHRGAQDFRVNNIAEEILRARQRAGGEIRSWQIVLGAIAGISLIVGGVGLMSVLLSSIGAPRYEFGLRKAIGAIDLEVFLQFLAESIILSMIGGALGVAGGVGIALWAGQFFPSGLPIQMTGLGIALGPALALGVLYGIYPALIASR